MYSSTMTNAMRIAYIVASTCSVTAAVGAGAAPDVLGDVTPDAGRGTANAIADADPDRDREEEPSREVRRASGALALRLRQAARGPGSKWAVTGRGRVLAALDRLEEHLGDVLDLHVLVARLLLHAVVHHHVAERAGDRDARTRRWRAPPRSARC